MLLLRTLGGCWYGASYLWLTGQVYSLTLPTAISQTARQCLSLILFAAVKGMLSVHICWTLICHAGQRFYMLLLMAGIGMLTVQMRWTLICHTAHACCAAWDQKVCSRRQPLTARQQHPEGCGGAL